MENNEKISDLKIVIIYGDKKVDGENRDGEIEEIPKEPGDTPINKNFFPHYSYMNIFLRDHFKDSPNLQRYANSRDINVLMFLLANEGHITMAETSYPRQKATLISMPRKLTEEQKRSLEQLQKKLKEEGYSVTVFYDYKLEDGLINGKETHGDTEVLNEFVKGKTQKEGNKPNDEKQMEF